MTASTQPSTEDRHAQTFATLAQRFGDGVFATSTFRDNVRLIVPKDRLIELLTALKDECGFVMLVELGGVDYLGYPGWSRSRFEVHYVVKNLDTGDVYPSVNAAADALGLDPSKIVKTCKGTRKTHGGYRWAYWEEVIP